MTVQQLIELSILEAMGLLDEDERSEFEGAFRAASAPIQAHVRREQTRLSQIESLLPDVQPPAGLRAMVIEAVRAHMAAALADDSRDDLAGLVIPMSRSRSVSPLWRAGALGMAAASVMLGITSFLLQNEYRELSDQIEGDALVSVMTSTLGSTFVRDMVFDGDTKRVVFKPVAQNFKGQASLFINPEWTSAKFFCNAIATPEGQRYKLAVLDDEGRVVQVLKEFNTTGGLVPIDVELRPGITGQIAILSGSESSQTVLTSGRIEPPTPAI